FYDVRYSGLNWPEDGTYARFFSGELEWKTNTPPYEGGDISPVSGEIVYWRNAEPATVGQALMGPGSGDIFRHSPDGSGEVNLTEQAGIGGLNCQPKWSPDGTMIAFQHCDPVEGMEHCQVGFHVWVMNADGTNAHRVTPEGSTPTIEARWLPDGSLLLNVPGDGDGWSWETITTDIWGTDMQLLPNVGGEAVCSPDGSMIVSIRWDDDLANGEPGQWNRLLLTNADGSDPRVLVQQFIVRAQVQAHYPTDEMLERAPRHDWVDEVYYHAGPKGPVWSPNGDKIAFLAALPFDPDGAYHMNQVEVWVYDLAADELIRVTDDDAAQQNLIWK
ncbi:MAG: PD40 domain-containing protein, partial [Armatimonadota bacterium]